MKTLLFSFFVIISLLFTTVNESKATSWCEQNGGTVYVTTLTINGCEVVVHYCWTNINGTGEAYFEILNIYVKAPCSNNILIQNYIISTIDRHIMLNHAGSGLVRCNPNNPNWGTVVHTSRSDCYKYQRAGYLSYNYNHSGGYSIVPCQSESLCAIAYSACYDFNPITGSPEITVRCNIPITQEGESTYGDNCNPNANSVFMSFWTNPFMTESECVMLDCYCIPYP